MRKVMLVLVAVAVMAAMVGLAYAAEPYKFLESQEIVNKYREIMIINDEMKRGEYEKKQEYENRIKAIQKDKVRPFSIEVANDRFQYDIDKEEFTFEKFFWYDNRLKFELHNEVNNLGEYPGENTFGVKKIIRKEEKYIFGIISKDFKSSSKFIKKYEFTFKFKCKPDVAKKNKAALVLVAEFMPVTENYNGSFYYLTGGIDYHKPTITEPYDAKTIESFFYATVRKFLVVNKETGEVIYSFDPK